MPNHNIYQIRSLQGPCSVYIIAHVENGLAVGPVKVGITASIDARMRQLRTANPKKIAPILVFEMRDREGAAMIEQAFHEVMSDYRLEGEWFDMTPAHAVAAMDRNFRAACLRFLGRSE